MPARGASLTERRNAGSAGSTLTLPAGHRRHGVNDFGNWRVGKKQQMFERRLVSVSATSTTVHGMRASLRDDTNGLLSLYVRFSRIL